MFTPFLQSLQGLCIKDTNRENRKLEFYNSFERSWKKTRKIKPTNNNRDYILR